MLKRATRRNKRRGQRNSRAWRRFSPDGETCRYCKHVGAQHLCQSGQPHFYRPATEAEKRDPTVTLYRHTLPQGGSVLVRQERQRPSLHVLLDSLGCCFSLPLQTFLGFLQALSPLPPSP